MFERTARLSGRQVAVLKTALSVSDKIHRHYKGSGDPSPFPKVAAKLAHQLPDGPIIRAIDAKLIGITTNRRERIIIRQSLDCLIANLGNIASDPERLHNVHVDIDVGELAASGVKLGRSAAIQLEQAQALREVFADPLHHFSHEFSRSARIANLKS